MPCLLPISDDKNVTSLSLIWNSVPANRFNLLSSVVTFEIYNSKAVKNVIGFYDIVAHSFIAE